MVLSDSASLALQASIRRKVKRYFDNGHLKISILQASRDTQPEEWSKSDFKEENNPGAPGSASSSVPANSSSPATCKTPRSNRSREHYQGKPTLDVDVYRVSHHGAENGTTV